MRGYKNATMYVVGLILRNGIPRQLHALDDTLTFVIAEEASGNVYITKTTAAGIEQSDSGEFVVLVSSQELNNVTFTKNDYYYMLRITEGDTGDTFPVQHGPLLLLDLPV